MEGLRWNTKKQCKLKKDETATRSTKQHENNMFEFN